MARKKSTPKAKQVETLRHAEATRKNIPTAEFQSVLAKEEQDPVEVRYPRGAAGLEEEKAQRNRDLDPQLVWRGKDEKDWSDLVVQAPPLFIQEKVHPKVLIDDLLRQSQKAKAERETEEAGFQPDLFADFNGLPDDHSRTEFYQHDANWANRMILGDSLQVMASLAEREGLRGKVQCIYIDPPYGIKFNSNFQWSTTSRDVKDGNTEHITREPEQVKAFRDTWRDGIHSYLIYLRDRLSVARDLLGESGSVFVQISNENVHRVRLILDEVFGERNAVATIAYKKASPDTRTIRNAFNYILWYARDIEHVKARKLFRRRTMADGTTEDPKKLALWLVTKDGEERPLTTEEKRSQARLPRGAIVFRADKVRDSGKMEGRDFIFEFGGESLGPGTAHSWRGDLLEMTRLDRANRLLRTRETLAYKYFISDNWGIERNNYWADTAGKIPDMRYVVETNEKIVTRCILIASDPGDLILDPTCGSGTAAHASERWGRRWITIDTSRVALALARARIMGARYPYYLLADSREGRIKEAEVTRTEPLAAPTRGDIRQGFIYERVPHITLKSIANDSEIDTIWERFEETLEPLRERLNTALGERWKEWEIPREADDRWPAAAKEAHSGWWQQRTARQREIDASITAKADFEFLYDKPYDDKKTVRVAGPFTVESISPHRVLGVDENDELIDELSEAPAVYGEARDFTSVILENLKAAGVQQAHKEDRIAFSSLSPWPGELICAEGRYLEGDSGTEKRAAIFIGPEFGTVSRPDLVKAAREAGDADFDVLIACAFSYEAHATEFSKLGRIPVLKARMNADLHMADELKSTGKGNLFVIFGEPDIDILPADGEGAADGQIQVRINGVDVFHPNTGEVRSDGPGGIACWFIDTDYNEESFFVRHAYFLGANDPYKSLKTTLKAEIDEEAWATLNSDTSRPFDKPPSGRIAVKVINHLGDEVMKVFRA
jgi:adenine-specific DNA-methyltransferase